MIINGKLAHSDRPVSQPCVVCESVQEVTRVVRATAVQILTRADVGLHQCAVRPILTLADNKRSFVFAKNAIFMQYELCIYLLGTRKEYGGSRAGVRHNRERVGEE